MTGNDVTGRAVPRQAVFTEREPAVPPRRTERAREYPLQFTGTAREYFGIWIVNVLLTVLTIGIYSAWAKVRTKRYFYGNTLLDNTPFDYLASPLTILKGWAIALVAFVLYSVIGEFFPLVGMGMALLFFMLIPMLVVRALAFRMYNTAYRNVRFNFTKNYNEAIRVFIGVGMLMGLTLGLLFPYYVFRQKKFIVNNSGFGVRNFTFNATKGDFFTIYTFASVWGLLLIVVLALAAQISNIGSFSPPMPLEPAAQFSATAAASDESATPGAVEDGSVSETEENDDPAAPETDFDVDADSSESEPEYTVPTFAWRPPVLLIVLIVAGMFALYAFLDTSISNLVLNKSEMRGVRLRSTLRVLPMMWLYLSNIVAIALSFGLLLPWARIRMARYRIGNVTVLATDLDAYIARESDPERALGEEFSDVFDVDVGI